MTNQLGIGGELPVSSMGQSTVKSDAPEIRISTERSQEPHGKEMTYLERKEEIKRIVIGMNDFLQATPTTNLQFEFHEDLGEYYVTLVDEVTREVVREIPSKKLLDIYSAMTDYIGLMVDKKI